MKKIVALMLTAVIILGTGMSSGGVSNAQGDSLSEFQAKSNGRLKIIQNNERKGPPAFVSGKLSEKQPNANGKNATQFLENHKGFFNMKNPNESLVEKKVEKDNLGMTQVRLQQVKNGVPVDKNQVIVHYDQENIITTVNGKFDPLIEEMSFDTKPTISVKDAIEIAKFAVAAPEEIDYEAAELIIYAFEGNYYLTYKVHLEFFKEDGEAWEIYVDAKTNKVVDKLNIMTGFGFFSDILGSSALAPAVKEEVKGPNPRAIERASSLKNARGSGIGVLGETKLLSISHGNIPGSGEGSKFYLLDTSIPGMAGIVTYNNKNSTSLNAMAIYENGSASWKGTIYSGDSSSWEIVGQGPGVDAHINARIVYEYFLNNHGRNSIDGNGMQIRSRVHRGVQWNNASWSTASNIMSYGDGDGKQFIPLTSLDVTAHEMVHGITSYMGGLRYRFETGAINEAFSDTFATIVDTRSWDVGEDIMGSEWLANGRTALRSNEDPGKFKVGEQYWAYSIDGEGRYPAHMDEYYFLPLNMDNGGVHINCTILQHSAYLVAEKYGMGRKVVADTWYRSYNYLHYDASFAEFREAILQSAIDLYGEESVEYNAFLSAFDDIGLYEGWSAEESFRAPLW